MSNLPRMPLFVDDYEAATAHLTLEEDGAYLRLLRVCWRMPHCTIPNDPAWIRRKMRVDQETYDRVVAPIIKEFFRRNRGRLYQKRLLSEFVYVDGVSTERSIAGKKGGVNSALKRRQNRDSKGGDLLSANEQQKASTHTHTHSKPPLPPFSKPKTNGIERDLENVALWVKKGWMPMPPLDRIRDALAAGLIDEDQARACGAI